MLSWKTWCALVVGTGLGAGGTVAVERVAPKRAVVKAAHKPAPATKPKPEPSAVRQPEPRAPLHDCPVSASIGPMPALGVPDLGGFVAPEPVASYFAPPLDAPWSIQTVRPAPTPGAIPEPSTWAMMIGGFGLVGMSLRAHLAMAR